MANENRLSLPIEELGLSDGALIKIREGSRCGKVYQLWGLSDKEFCWQMHFTMEEAKEILDKMEQAAEEQNDNYRVHLVNRRREYLMKYEVDYEQYINSNKS